MGLGFEYHWHGNGPMHYSAEVDGTVLEFYPLTKSQKGTDKNFRLGFSVDDLGKTIEALQGSNWIVLSPVNVTEWGKTVVIQDLDERKIELKGKGT